MTILRQFPFPQGFAGRGVEAGHLPLVGTDNELPVLEGRRRDVGPEILPGPRDVRRGHVPLSAALHGGERAPAGIGGDDEIARHHRRGDRTKVFLTAGVQPPHAPQLAAVGGVVGSDMVRAEHEHHFGRLAEPLLPLHHQRRRVALRRLLRGIEVAVVLPEELAVGAAEGGEIARSGLHHGHDDRVARQHRARAEIPPQRVLAEPLLEILPPGHDAGGEVERGQLPTLEVDPDMLPVGHRRGIAAGRLGMLSRLLRPEGAPPALLAGAIEADRRVVAVDRAGEHDRIAPHRRRARPEPRQRHLPGDMRLRAPARRKPGPGGDPIERGTAPIGPVLGTRR